jgi:membrane-associated phospholipid phosphatase
VLRIASDKHWASDVFVGHMIGFTVGYLLPTLIYYKRFQKKPEEQQPTTMDPGATVPPQVSFGGQF